MKGWGKKLVAVLVTVAFLVGFSGMLTGHANAQEKGAAAAGKAGAEAGAATAAGISTGTIVAGVIAAAAIAAIAAASGGDGGAVSVAQPSAANIVISDIIAGTQDQNLPETVTETVTPLEASLALLNSISGAYDQVGQPKFSEILSEISFSEFQGVIETTDFAKAVQNFTEQQKKLIDWLSNIKAKDKKAYNNLLAVLKQWAKKTEQEFKLIQNRIKESKQAFLEELLNLVNTVITTSYHPGYKVYSTQFHHGGGIYTTQYHLIKQP